MEVIEGIITGYDERGIMTLTAQYDNPERFIKRRYKAVLIGLEDDRRITPEQRRKAYALINEISDWSGNPPDYIKELTKMQSMKEEEIKLYKKLFSLADCSMETASRYISHLVDMVLYWDVPTRRPLQELCDDIAKYLFSCLKHKKCSVCGRRGELHHMEAIGMGNDREEVIQEGMECMCLCREHHTEYHKIGRQSFLQKYHFDAGVRMNDELCKVWKVRRKKP